MAIVNRGFQGRRRQPGAGLVPPGQYVVDDFPVLTAGPTPSVPLDGWDFTVVDDRGAVAAGGRGRSCAPCRPRTSPLTSTV